MRGFGDSASVLDAGFNVGAQGWIQWRLDSNGQDLRLDINGSIPFNGSQVAKNMDFGLFDGR